MAWILCPPGICNPKTFLEVGQYLHTLFVTQMNHGCDPFWPNGRISRRPRSSYRLSAKSVSVYYPTHSWTDTASVVDGIWKDRAWRNSGGELLVSIYETAHLYLQRLSPWSSLGLFRTPWPTNAQCPLSRGLTRLSRITRTSMWSLHWPGQSILLYPKKKKKKDTRLFSDFELTITAIHSFGKVLTQLSNSSIWGQQAPVRNQSNWR